MLFGMNFHTLWTQRQQAILILAKISYFLRPMKGTLS